MCGDARRPERLVNNRVSRHRLGALKRKAAARRLLPSERELDDAHIEAIDETELTADGDCNRKKSNR